MSSNDYVITIRMKDRQAAMEMFDLVGDMDGVENVLLSSPDQAESNEAKADRIINGHYADSFPSFMSELLREAEENCSECADTNCPAHPKHKRGGKRIIVH